MDIDVAVRPVHYQLVIGTDLTCFIAEDLKKRSLAGRYAVISDSKVAPLWAEGLLKALNRQGLAAKMFTFPAGEKSKNREVKEQLENEMLEAHFTRDSAVMALGGGVTGDLAGFVAATYMRGVPVVQIPTTTLSMADSSIGGKTGVDTPYGKNLIGAFHHPTVVYMDMKCLSTLDERNYTSGLAELIKHGFIRDVSLLDYVESHVSEIARRDTAVLEEMFQRNCHVKNEVVAEDDHEKGVRQILNYGHTMGHAVEMAAGFTLQHGECVSIGMAFAARLAAMKGLCSKEWADRQVDILEKLHLPTCVPAAPGHEKPDSAQLLSLMKMDKKTRGGQIRFVFTTEPGKVVYGVPVSEEEIVKALEECEAQK